MTGSRPVLDQIEDQMKELHARMECEGARHVRNLVRLFWIHSRVKNRFHYHLKCVDFQLKTGLVVKVRIS